MKNGKCPAYPFGIPDKILSDRIFHDKILDGQVGTYIFEQRKEVK